MRTATISRKTAETAINVTVNLDGSGLEQVTFDTEFDGFPEFSPDGKKLVWASNRGDGAGNYNTAVWIADWK